MLPDHIEREIVINAPVERVWTTLTSAEHLGKWFADNGAEIDLKPGGSIVFRWKDYGTTYGRVEKVESPNAFDFRWATRPGVEPDPDNSTLVEFTLSPQGSGTRLRVLESGFLSLALSEEEKAKRVEEHTGGWKDELNELRDYTQALVAA
jgi:uncharacterized protein YndB with AHSA1/START domain